MRYNTEKNREKLALEAVDQMDMDTMTTVIQEQLETYYGTLLPGDFTREWEQAFGED